MSFAVSVSVVAKTAAFVKGDRISPIIIRFDDDAAVAAATRFREQLSDQAPGDALAAEAAVHGHAHNAARILRLEDKGAGAYQVTPVFDDKEVTVARTAVSGDVVKVGIEGGIDEAEVLPQSL